MKTKLKTRALELKGPMAVTLWAVPVDRENPSVRRFFYGGVIMAEEEKKAPEPSPTNSDSPEAK